jgi:hypothetical protein
MSAQLHADAILTRLRTSGSPALTVYDGRVPSTTPLPTPPYVVVRFTCVYQGPAVRPDASALDGDARALQVTARVYSVAASGQAARAVNGRVATALLNWRPTVAGRSCSPLRHIDQFETPPDERTGTTYFELGDDYRFTSIPA